MDEQKKYDIYHNHFKDNAYTLTIQNEIGSLCKKKGITKTLEYFTGKTTVKEMRDKICETLGKGFEEGGTILKNPHQDLRVRFGLMPNLTQIIPAPNEEDLNKTLEDCLENCLKGNDASQTAPMGSIKLLVTINSPTPEPIQKLNEILETLKGELKKEVRGYNEIRSSSGSDIPPLRALEDVIEKIRLHYTETPKDTSNKHGIERLNLSPEVAILQTTCSQFSKDVLQTDKSYQTHLYNDASKNIVQAAIKYILEINPQQREKYLNRALDQNNTRHSSSQSNDSNDCTMM